MSIALLGATALPIIVAVTAIGIDEKILSIGECRAPGRRGHALGAGVPARRDDHPRRAQHVGSRPARGRSGVTSPSSSDASFQTLFAAARVALAAAPQEPLGELRTPRRVLGMARASRIVRVGKPGTSGVLLIGADAVLRDRRHRARPRRGPARLHRRVAARASRARRRSAARRVRRGRGGARRVADAASRRTRRGRGIRSPGMARGRPERAVERLGRLGAARGATSTSGSRCCSSRRRARDSGMSTPV